MVLLSLSAKGKSAKTFSFGRIALRKIDLADTLEVKGGIGRDFMCQRQINFKNVRVFNPFGKGEFCILVFDPGINAGMAAAAAPDDFPI